MLEKLTDRFTDGVETRTDGGSATLGVLNQIRTDRDGATASDPAPAGSGSDGAGDQGVAIGLDEIFGLLKNRRRRSVFRYLTAESEPLRLGGLAEQIAARENDKAVSRIGSKERKRVYVALYQCHLPKMADVDAISYDKPRGTVGRGPNFDLFEYHLPSDEDTVGPPQSRHDRIRAFTSLVA